MKKTNCVWMVLVACLVVGFVPVGQVEGSYTALYVFGDSFSDVGNVSILSGGTFPESPPYAGGRISNGAVYAEVLAHVLAIGELSPSLMGGTNYAYLGARVAEPNPLLPIPVPSVQDQVAAFIGGLGEDGADPDALYLVEGGGNDEFVAFTALGQGSIGWPDAVAMMEQAARDLADVIEVLKTVGATHFVTNNVYDLGLARLFGASPETATGLINVFNAALAMELADLNDTDIVVFDMYDFINDIKDDFLYLESSCVGDLLDPGSLCESPDDYLFFDDYGHPTASAHRLIGTGLAISILKNKVGSLVTTGVLNHGQGNALSSKLNTAFEKLGDREMKPMHNQLNAFINQVQGLVEAGILSMEDAEGLWGPATD